MLMMKRSNYLFKSLITIIFIFTFVASINATQYRLFRTKKAGNVVTLTAKAKITGVSRTIDVKTYTLWRNGTAYISIGLPKYTPKTLLSGVLPPGRYVLKILGNPISLGTSVSINLDTVYQPFRVLLWGQQNKFVKPLWTGNVVTVAIPTGIVSEFYNGTHSMGIFPWRVNRAILRYISPHNIFNPGPKVIGGTGGKTLVGQILPMGVYTLTPGRGKADGIVQGRVVLDVR